MKRANAVGLRVEWSGVLVLSVGIVAGYLLGRNDPELTPPQVVEVFFPSYSPMEADEGWQIVHEADRLAMLKQPGGWDLKEQVGGVLRVYAVGKTVNERPVNLQWRKSK
jgi:hypothetical protein